MKSNQKGFSAIQIVLMIVVVSVIGFTGWYVYRANQKPGSSSTSITPNCPGSNLTLSELNTAGAAGTKGITYAVTNKSTQSCIVQGYPTIALIDSHGKQLGHDAEPSSSEAGSAVTLKPGKVAYVTVLLPNPANFTSGQCDSQQSAYLRLIPLGETSSVQVALSGEQYCPGFSTQAFTPNLSP